MFRPPSLLATQVARTTMELSIGRSRDFYFRAVLASLPLQVSDMLVVRIDQLTTRDSHPIRFAALSAAPAFVALHKIIYILYFLTGRNQLDYQ